MSDRNEVTNTMLPNELNDILVKLKFLSLIKREQSVNFATMTIHNVSFWSSFCSMFYTEDSKGMLRSIKTIVEDAIVAISDYKNTEYLVIITDYLSEAQIGLHNLLITYNYDPVVVSNLKVIIDNVTMHLKKIKLSN